MVIIKEYRTEWIKEHSEIICVSCRREKKSNFFLKITDLLFMLTLSKHCIPCIHCIFVRVPEDPEPILRDTGYEAVHPEADTSPSQHSGSRPHIEGICHSGVFLGGRKKQRTGERHTDTVRTAFLTPGLNSGLECCKSEVYAGWTSDPLWP